jgi:MFS family permease
MIVGPKDLTAPERRAITAAYAGWGLDGFDVMIYSFVIPTLITALGLAKSQAGLIATATLLCSALGGWAAGALSDRFGRVRLLQVTVAWFAVFACLCGFARGFTSLLVLRSLQGLGFGGEWAVGSALVGEIVRPAWRGRAVGFVQSAWAVGWGVAAGLYALLFSRLPAGIAWRAMFWVGILPALLVLYIRRYVRDATPMRDAAIPDATAGSSRGRFLAIFSPALLRTTLLASLMATGMQGGYYSVTTWLPTFLKTTRGLSVLDTGGYLAVVIVGSLAGYLVAADLCDRFGRRASFATFALGSGLTAYLYTRLPIDNTAMLWLGFPLGFFVSGIFSGVGAFFTELFPGGARGSGVGFAFSFGRGLGALFPALVGFAGARIGLGPAIGLFATIAYALVLLAITGLPETRGRVLETSAPR